MDDFDNSLACAIADVEAANNALQAMALNESTLYEAFAAAETLAVASAVLAVLLEAQSCGGDWFKAMGISPQKDQAP